MAINVEYAPRGGGYSQSQSQRRNYRPEEDDEESINPYALSRREGAQISARLRSDRERLGQKQRQKYGDEYFRDTEAGFDIHEPVTVWQDEQNGVRTGKVLYRNLGKDPIGTGGFGSLGGGEKIVYDYGQTINPNDAADMGLLGQVLSRKGQNNLQLSGDTFLSPEEKRAKEEDRQFKKFEREQTLRNEMAGKLDEEQYQRTSKRDEAKAQRASAFEAEKRQRERQEKLDTLRSEVEGDEFAADLLSGPENASPEYKQALEEERAARRKLAEARMAGKIDDIAYARGLKQIEERVAPVKRGALSGWSPVQYDKDGNAYQTNWKNEVKYLESPSVKREKEFEEFTKRRDVMSKERAANELAKEGIDPREARRLAAEAEVALYKAKGVLPTAQEVKDKVKQMIQMGSEISGQNRAGASTGGWGKYFDQAKSVVKQAAAVGGQLSPQAAQLIVMQIKEMMSMGMSQEEAKAALME